MNDNNENRSDLIIYSSEDGKITVEVRIEDENVWLTQNLMAELFQTTQQNISFHILNILEEGELLREATHKEYLLVRREGNRDIRRRLDYYNLDMIIAVGYRVKSAIGTKFRIWATQRLREFLVKGFIMDDERLKEGRNIGSDYFDELLERIRDIRASEKRFYQKIRDIYKLAVDYDPQAAETKLFFQIVQNKLHFAISGRTAAELIAERADATKPNMGLTAFKGTKVRKADVTIAKNYLNAEEVEALNRIVNMYLDYAEDQAKLHRKIHMADWRKKLDAFLEFYERDVLDDAGRMAKEVADRLAEEQYEIFHQHRLEAKAQREAWDDDEALRKYLEGEK